MTTKEPYPMAKKYDAEWANAVTVVDEARPPFIPQDAQVKTVVAELPPGSTGFPPHRHSGPSFYYMLEGELRSQLEGESPRIIRAGEAFWEPGGDVIHYTNANEGDDVPCRFVVTMLSRPDGPQSELVL